jgi:hypothetical protein
MQLAIFAPVFSTFFLNLALLTEEEDLMVFPRSSKIAFNGKLPGQPMT